MSLRFLLVQVTHLGLYVFRYDMLSLRESLPISPSPQRLWKREALENGPQGDEVVTIFQLLEDGRWNPWDPKNPDLNI